MAINLSKGQRATVAATKFTIGLGWDENNTDTGVEFDLDASIFICNDNHKLISESHFIFYNNLSDPEKAVNHSGDNRTGSGEGDDESIAIDLTKINPNATELNIVVTIHDAIARHQNFGQVRNAYIRIIDENNNELMKYELDEDFSIETAIEFGRIYKRNNEWKFEAVGTGMKGGLESFVQRYQ
ncbi:chemical-damaging agent resistance protein C [Actinobacillus delphinicola]|uniref:TerD family protein n=1 Tax=Actinobacillus delphinicola TaxID=51161 RepID=UPI002442A60B|nr:TerD family protein [Actinobacillus delphinicola]MDG6897042.1 chemical-damaging agent resistance protein C [Actinobacillus delphinicola]